MDRGLLARPHLTKETGVSPASNKRDGRDARIYQKSGQKSGRDARGPQLYPSRLLYSPISRSQCFSAAGLS